MKLSKNVKSIDLIAEKTHPLGKGSYRMSTCLTDRAIVVHWGEYFLTGPCKTVPTIV